MTVRRNGRDQHRLAVSVLCFSLILVGAFADWLRLTI